MGNEASTPRSGLVIRPSFSGPPEPRREDFSARGSDRTSPPATAPPELGGGRRIRRGRGRRLGRRTGRRRLEGSRLRPVSDATTVWPKEGGTFVSDGPFAETKEFIAGYDIIECADLAEAVEIAAGHPVAKFGAIELRPVWE